MFYLRWMEKKAAPATATATELQSISNTFGSHNNMELATCCYCLSVLCVYVSGTMFTVQYSCSINRIAWKGIYSAVLAVNGGTLGWKRREKKICLNIDTTWIRYIFFFIFSCSLSPVFFLSSSSSLSFFFSFYRLHYARDGGTQMIHTHSHSPNWIAT